MEHILIKLPDRILNCIRSRYPGHSLICSKEDTDSEDNAMYIVDLLLEGKYCHLRINDVGKVVHEVVEPQFIDDYHEQYY